MREKDRQTERERQAERQRQKKESREADKPNNRELSFNVLYQESELSSCHSRVANTHLLRRWVS